MSRGNKEKRYGSVLAGDYVICWKMIFFSLSFSWRFKKSPRKKKRHGSVCSCFNGDLDQILFCQDDRRSPIALCGWRGQWKVSFSRKHACEWQELLSLNWEDQICIMWCIVGEAHSLSATAPQQWANNLNSDISTLANNGLVEKR